MTVAIVCLAHLIHMYDVTIWMHTNQGVLVIVGMKIGCHWCEWVVSMISMSRVAENVNESCHAYEWAMSCIWMSNVTRMNESCHACEWVMSRIWMSHVTHMNESCHTYEGVISGARYDSWPQIWLMHMRDMTHWYMWHDSFVRVTCLIREQRFYKLFALELGTSRIRMNHVARTNESCRTYEWIMSHVRMNHVARTNECHAYEWVVCHTYEWVMPHTHERVMSHTWMSHVTRMNWIDQDMHT